MENIVLAIASDALMVFVLVVAKLLARERTGLRKFVPFAMIAPALVFLMAARFLATHG